MTLQFQDFWVNLMTHNFENLLLLVKTLASPFLALDPNRVVSTSNAGAYCVKGGYDIA